MEQPTFQTSLDLTAGSSRSGAKYKLGLSSRNNTTSSSSGAFVIAALIEGRGGDRGKMGMAYIDLRHSELTLCEFVDSASYTYTKMQLGIVEPIEVIFPEFPADRNSSAKLLYELIRAVCPNAEVNSVQRRHFSDARGSEMVQQLALPECSHVDSAILKKHYALSAAAALLKYIEFIQNVMYARKTLKVTYTAIDDCCLIDLESWASMDLVSAEKHVSKGKASCLLDLLNCCVTPGGQRTLRSCLLQPSANVDVINTRLDVVEELVQKQTMLQATRALISNLHDLQQMITMFVHISLLDSAGDDAVKRTVRTKISQVLSLKELLTVVRQLRGILKQSNALFIEENRAKIEDPRLDDMWDLMEECIDMNEANRKRKGVHAKESLLNAVKEGQNVYLDLARRAYAELVEHIQKKAEEEQKNIPNCQLVYTFSRGYHLMLHANMPLSVRLPKHCISVVHNRASLSFTTRDLIRYNDRLDQIEVEIMDKSNMVVDKLVGSLREYLPGLYNLVEFLSQLDYFCSIATYSLRASAVRPTFGAQTIVKHGRHPILDCNEKDVVPNDLFMVPDTRFLIITGPNMAGKSTYLKQTCLLQVMAQAGCFVPADYASFVVVSRIFSRMGQNDDIGHGLSSFALEMSEMATMLQSANEKSLIVIDELARSTSTEEGIAICYALCEEFIRLKAFVLFATHYLDLSLLETNFSAVQNFHFPIESKKNPDGTETLVPLRQLCKGPYNGPLYGFELAALTTLPASILESAKKMAHSLRADIEQHHFDVANDDKLVKQRKLARLAQRILQLDKLKETSSKEELSKYLLKLRLDYQRNELV